MLINTDKFINIYLFINVYLFIRYAKNVKRSNALS